MLLTVKSLIVIAKARYEP